MLTNLDSARLKFGGASRVAVARFRGKQLRGKSEAMQRAALGLYRATQLGRHAKTRGGGTKADSNGGEVRHRYEQRRTG